MKLDGMGHDSPPQTRPQILLQHLADLLAKNYHSAPPIQTFPKIVRRSSKMSWVRLFDQRRILRHRECHILFVVVDPKERNMRLLRPRLGDEHKYLYLTVSRDVLEISR